MLLGFHEGMDINLNIIIYCVQPSCQTFCIYDIIEGL